VLDAIDARAYADQTRHDGRPRAFTADQDTPGPSVTGPNGTEQAASTAPGDARL
jgi:hypothetical protein